MGSGGDTAKLKTETTLFVLEDPDGCVARALQSGADLREFSDRLRSSVTVYGNMVLDEGREYILKAIAGVAGLTPFDGNNAHIGVGNSTAPEHPSQTGLMGTSKYYKRVDTGYPKLFATSIVFRATFGPDEANFDWMEWTIANGSSDDAVNLNRKVAVLGRKDEGTTWVLQVSVSIS
ncbi:MAG: hypothetical protein QXU30_07925 [Sulfolobales archaeon]